MADTEFSGNLWQRVRFERLQDTADGLGGTARMWITVDTRWAAVLSAPMIEASYAGRVATLNRYHITLRRGADIDLKWRAVWNTKKLSILSLDQPTTALDRVILLCQLEREQ